LLRFVSLLRRCLDHGAVSRCLRFPQPSSLPTPRTPYPTTGSVRTPHHYTFACSVPKGDLRASGRLTGALRAWPRRRESGGLQTRRRSDSETCSAKQNIDRQTNA
jgi:hypothetical protein